MTSSQALFVLFAHPAQLLRHLSLDNVTILVPLKINEGYEQRSPSKDSLTSLTPLCLGSGVLAVRHEKPALADLRCPKCRACATPEPILPQLAPDLQRHPNQIPNPNAETPSLWFTSSPAGSCRSILGQLSVLVAVSMVAWLVLGSCAGRLYFIPFMIIMFFFLLLFFFFVRWYCLRN